MQRFRPTLVLAIAAMAAFISACDEDSTNNNTTTGECQTTADCADPSKQTCDTSSGAGKCIDKDNADPATKPDPTGKKCHDSSDCDAPKERCGTAGVCEANPDYSEPSGKPCHDSSDCDAPKERCGTAGVCEANPDYSEPDPGTQPKKCHDTGDCNAPKERCGSEGVCEANPDYTEPDPSDSPEPKEKPLLTFKLTYGANNSQFSHTQSWRNILGGYASNSDAADLIVLLCNVDDETCKNPAKVIHIPFDEKSEYGYTTAIQKTSGSTIELRDIPDGNYKMMVIADSAASKACELDYEKTHATAADGADWGGYASETDMLLSDSDAADNVNPAPKAVDVTITAGETQDLGSLMLTHFFERDISTYPAMESGRLVVATRSGLRVIDLNTYELIQAPGSKLSYDFKMVNDKNEVITDSICGIAPYSNELLWVLFKSSATDINGYAVPFNPKTLKQIGNKRVNFPSIGSGSPCKGVAWGVYDSDVQWVDQLYVANYPGPEGAKEGLWTANVKQVLDDAANVEANVYKATDDLLFKAGAYQLKPAPAGKPGHLLMLPVPSAETTGKLVPECATHACVFALKQNEDGTVEVAKKDGSYVYIDAGDIRDKVSDEIGQDLICNPNKFSNPGMTTVLAAENRFLFISKCHNMAAFDIRNFNEDYSVTHIDMDDDAPGIQDIETYLYGQFMQTFEMSPDYKTLWALPANSALVKLYGYDRSHDTRISYDRFAAMAIDITSEKPKIVEEYNQNNIDNYKGHPAEDLKTNYTSPEIDPGIDLTNLWLHQYIIDFFPSLQGATPYFTVTAPKLAVTEAALFVTNTSVENAGSNFGQYSDIAIYDLKSQRGVLYPQKDQDFYHVFSGGTDDAFGYQLTPGATTSMESFGIVYVDMKE